MANTHENDTIVKQSRWWSRRTRLERSLTILTSLFLIIVVCLIVALAVLLATNEEVKILYKRETSAFVLDTRISNTIQRSFPVIDNNFLIPTTRNICLTPGCVSAASNLLKHMNRDVDPCDDFYEFACGNFIKNTKIPDDKVSVNTFTVINDELQQQLRNLLESEPSKDEPAPFQLARNFYASCMNTTEIEEDDTKTLQEVINELGQWPVLEKAWSESSFYWVESMNKFLKVGYGSKYIIDFSISPDIKNSSKRMITLDQPLFGLNREYLIKGKEDKLVSSYYDYMVDVAVLLGADKEEAKKDLWESLKLEIEMSNISLPQEERRDANALYHAFTIKQLSELHPSVEWMEIFNKLLSPNGHVTEEDYLIVYVPSYIDGIIKLMERTPKRVQANYVIWRAVKDSIVCSSNKLRQRKLAYSKIFAGISAHEPRWKECVSIVSGSFPENLYDQNMNIFGFAGLGIAVGSMYVRKHFDEDSKKTAVEMVQDIRSEFRSNLEQVAWMDEETRAAALKKADKMAAHIAYPQELMDNSKINAFYEGLVIEPHKYLRSLLNYTKFGVDYTIKRMRQPVNKTEWSTHGQPAVVNAFYSSIENSIQFPAGVLQGDFFSNQRPRYMNYGAIGFIIAHEITHGFDDQGSQFDEEGNLYNWWAENTKAQYLKRARCIIDQYSNYTADEVDLNLNGINTQGENIADNVGLKEVYFAYVKWVERNGEEPALPGLSYTPKQLFWLSAANVWCSVQRPETLKRQITLGVHSPGRFRVLGPMSNMPQFSQDFKCPVNSNMNPMQRCTVW